MDVRNPAIDEAEPPPDNEKTVNVTLKIKWMDNVMDDEPDHEPDALEIADSLTEGCDFGEWWVEQAQVTV